ncbi:MAG: twin-arginine translocase TatA/TatE family subunit, partial [Acidimicrobiales bacterium]|nr:twin-arginine translocase TatA/TatE family subunit [Acidimicrobiales bacterium]
MFNVTGGELVIIFVAALVILGPERLPEAARTVGKVMAQLRSVSQGFQKELQSALDETGEPFREMVRPRLTSLDGGAKPDAAEKPRSAAMFDANSPTRPEPDPDPGWSTPPRPELPTEVGPDVRPEAALPDALAPDAV